MPANPVPPPPAAPTRRFGRFELRQLLGKSAATMVWLARDPRGSHDVMLTLPRVQPVEDGALEHWLREVRAAARLDHPNLARIVEVGVQDHWPFMAVDREQGSTLGEWLASHPNAPVPEVVGWMCQLLRGLAFAHEAGVVHLDLQLHSVLINERGQVCLMGCAAAGIAGPASREATLARSVDDAMAVAPSALRAQRAAASRDLLACGVLLHHLLTGQPALGQADTALVMLRMAPAGREMVRLPWSTPLPIPEPLRAIVNRCTSGQERLRYSITRTLLGALTGWLEAQAQDGGGPLGLLLDRLRTVGHLPALPGLAARVARVTSLEGQRTDEIADQVLVDMALSFELLRTLNSAQVQGTQIQGNGPVLTLRRIISLIGVNGVRLAANTLRQWPGPLSETHAAALRVTLEQVRLAGHLAQALRPPGYDAQVIYLIAVLQNLGRLMLRYHFADEAEQIQQLMKSHPADREADTPEQPGLSEQAAAFAVLGVDIESLGIVVARSWGLGDDVLHMVRRLPADATVRKPDSDADVLRLTASVANDCVDAVGRSPAPRAAAATAQVAQRYARALGLTARELSDALLAARETQRKGTPAPGSMRGGAAAASVAEPDANADAASPVETTAQ
jgi:non-specific serine/threonine protein kinase